MQLMIYLVAYGEICGAYGDFMKFDVYDIESECTEYPEKRNEKKPITKFITVSDKLWDKMKDADRVVFEKASDKVLGLVYYAEKRN